MLRKTNPARRSPPRPAKTVAVTISPGVMGNPARSNFRSSDALNPPTSATSSPTWASGSGIHTFAPVSGRAGRSASATGRASIRRASSRSRRARAVEAKNHEPTTKAARNVKARTTSNPKAPWSRGLLGAALPTETARGIRAVDESDPAGVSTVIVTWAPFADSERY